MWVPVIVFHRFSANRLRRILQTGGDRGRWMYRGYLIGEGEGLDRPGGGEGFFAGRWRETLTPAETFGYEGAFAMGRRG